MSLPGMKVGPLTDQDAETQVEAGQRLSATRLCGGHDVVRSADPEQIGQRRQPASTTPGLGRGRQKVLDAEGREVTAHLEPEPGPALRRRTGRAADDPRSPRP
jgi:hypothetical protein